MDRDILLRSGPREECGVFGIYAPGEPVAELSYLALMALQHRGQDGAGVAVSGEDTITVVKNRGLVDRALNDGKSLTGLEKGGIASAHVRYSTVETATVEEQVRAAQPMFGESYNRKFTLSHNGHVINLQELRQEVGITDQVTDSEVITALVAKELGPDNALEDAVAKACRQINGAYTLVVMGQSEIIGIRDPKGFRPLILGETSTGGYAIASELAALNVSNAKMIREIEAGEMVRIDEAGVHSSFPFEEDEVEDNLCAFEFVYFSRPDNELMGESVEQVRFRTGQLLAEQAPVDADIVIAVPNSGVSAAHGFVESSKLPIQFGLIKNAYSGRIFMTPGQVTREQMTKAKLSAIESVVKDKRVVAVDDSIIHSTTTKAMVEMLRDAGAQEVHLRIASPPYRWPCFYGMNTGNINELIAASKTVEEIREEVGADSLEYLSVDSLGVALGKAAGRVCTACMTKRYPTPVPTELLEKSE